MKERKNPPCSGRRGKNTTREMDNPFLLFGGGGSFSSLPLLRCGGSSPPLFVVAAAFFTLSLSEVSLVRTVGGGPLLPSRLSKQSLVELAQTIEERSATDQEGERTTKKTRREER